MIKEIKQADGRFYVGNIAHPEAEITYKEDDGKTVVIDHTIVSEKLQGKGIASELVRRVVEFARENDKQIVPQCSYAIQKMKETPEYHDVWKG